MKTIAYPVFAVLLSSCAALEEQMRISATGARFATTAETAPAVWFDTPPAATGKTIAGWCTGETRLESVEAGDALVALLGDAAKAMSVEWSLDSRSEGLVECSSKHEYSTRHSGGLDSQVLANSDSIRRGLGQESASTGSVSYDFIHEWVAFGLASVDEGTCVIASPEVKRNQSERQTGSYTDLEGVLTELGGKVVPKCAVEADAGEQGRGTTSP